MSVIIPTIGTDKPETCASVPDAVETVVVRGGNRSEARNTGVKRATGTILVFCDDDIVFDEPFFWKQVNELKYSELRGLEDYGLDLIITRFMAIHRMDFEQIGGFDERLDHMEDTDFGMRAQHNGIDVNKISRSAVEHIPHENDITTQKRIKTLAYIGLKHRHRSAPIFSRLLG